MSLHSFLLGGEEYGDGSVEVYAHTNGHPDYVRQARIVHDQMRTHGWAVSKVIPADPVGVLLGALPRRRIAGSNPMAEA